MRCIVMAVKLSFETVDIILPKTLVFEYGIKIGLAPVINYKIRVELILPPVWLELQMIRRSLERPPAAPVLPTKPE
jgi:hypothetical protein